MGGKTAYIADTWDVSDFYILHYPFNLLRNFNDCVYRSKTDLAMGHGSGHRRRMETEGKAKVVASVWGVKFVQFLAALAVLSRAI